MSPLTLTAWRLSMQDIFLAGESYTLVCSSPTGNATESWRLGFGLYGLLKLFHLELGFFNKVIFQLYFIFCANYSQGRGKFHAKLHKRHDFKGFLKWLKYECDGFKMRLWGEVLIPYQANCSSERVLNRIPSTTDGDRAKLSLGQRHLSADPDPLPKHVWRARST